MQRQSPEFKLHTDKKIYICIYIHTYRYIYTRTHTYIHILVILIVLVKYKPRLLAKRKVEEILEVSGTMK
jgi:hypothetical protein